MGITRATLVTHSTTKSQRSAGEQMKAQLLKMRKQLDVEQVQVEDHRETHTGEEEENDGERERPRC